MEWHRNGRVKVAPESPRGAERAEAGRHIVDLAPGYAAYQEKTESETLDVRPRAVA